MASADPMRRLAAITKQLAPSHVAATRWGDEAPDADGLQTRHLRIDDYEKGFPKILEQLTTVGDVSKAQFEKQFHVMNASETYHVMVIEDTTKNKIIAAATLVVERKFIHECAKCGHVEDVVVDKTYRGKALGRRIIDCLRALARHHGCYKIILDCDDHNIPFYERLGYKVKANHMAQYLE